MCRLLIIVFQHRQKCASLGALAAGNDFDGDTDIIILRCIIISFVEDAFHERAHME